MNDLTLRPLAADDSIEALTALLHASYASLAAQGWNFTAVDQSVQTTRERVASGQAFVALSTTGELVGTVTVAPLTMSTSGGRSAPLATGRKS